MQFVVSESSSKDEADLAEIAAGLREFSAEIRSAFRAIAGRHRKTEMEIDEDNIDEEKIDLGAESGEESADEDEYENLYKSFKEDASEEEEEVEMEILDA